jgi:hypothetical protein
MSRDPVGTTQDTDRAPRVQPPLELPLTPTSSAITASGAPATPVEGTTRSWHGRHRSNESFSPSKTDVKFREHVKLGKGFYSVPWRLLGQEVDVRATDKLVQIYHHGDLVKTHVRTDRGRVTDFEDYPPVMWNLASVNPGRPLSADLGLAEVRRRARDWVLDLEGRCLRH